MTRMTLQFGRAIALAATLLGLFGLVGVASARIDPNGNDWWRWDRNPRETGSVPDPNPCQAQGPIASAIYEALDGKQSPVGFCVTGLVSGGDVLMYATHCTATTTQACSTAVLMNCDGKIVVVGAFSAGTALKNGGLTFNGVDVNNGAIVSCELDGDPGSTQAPYIRPVDWRRVFRWLMPDKDTARQFTRPAP